MPEGVEKKEIENDKKIIIIETKITFSYITVIIVAILALVVLVKK